MAEKSWIYCGHANECPQSCPCGDDCICRDGMCKNKAGLVPFPTAVNDRGVEKSGLTDKLWNLVGATNNQALRRILEEEGVEQPQMREPCPFCHAGLEYVRLHDNHDGPYYWGCGNCGVLGPLNDYDGKLWDEIAKPARVMRELERWCTEKINAIESDDLSSPDDKYNVGMNHVLRGVLRKIRGE